MCGGKRLKCQGGRSDDLDRLPVGESHLPAMCLKDLFCNPKPHDMRGFLRVRKGAAQGLDHRFWDAAAVVRYLETDPVWPFGTGGHSNRAAFGIVPDTVADQVGKSPG